MFSVRAGGYVHRVVPIRWRTIPLTVRARGALLRKLRTWWSTTRAAK